MENEQRSQPLLILREGSTVEAMILLKSGTLPYSVNRNRSMSRLSASRKKRKSLIQAHLCKFRGFCLDVCIDLGFSAIPCQGCCRRQNIGTRQLKRDAAGSILLILAILYPDCWDRKDSHPAVDLRINPAKGIEYIDYYLAKRQ